MYEKKDELKVLMTKDLMNLMGIGRDKAYSLMRARTFPSTKLGKTYFVTMDSLQTWLHDNAGKSIEV